MTYLTSDRDALAKALHDVVCDPAGDACSWLADENGDPACLIEHAGPLADALIASGAVIPAATLADDEALMRHTGQMWLVHQNDYHGQDLTPHTRLAERVVRALAAALTERSQ